MNNQFEQMSGLTLTPAQQTQGQREPLAIQNQAPVQPDVASIGILYVENVTQNDALLRILDEVQQTHAVQTETLKAALEGCNREIQLLKAQLAIVENNKHETDLVHLQAAKVAQQHICELNEQNSDLHEQVSILKLWVDPIGLRPSKVDEYARHLQKTVKSVLASRHMIGSADENNLKVNCVLPENLASLSRWLKARDTLIFWDRYGREFPLGVPCVELLTAESMIQKAAEYNKWYLEHGFELMRFTTVGLCIQALSGLPGIICEFVNLRILSLKYNGIKTLPRQISNLQNLEILNIEQNPLCGLPTEIGQLRSLNALYCSREYYSGCGLCKEDSLKALPTEIGNLHQLKEVLLQGNEIQAIPTQIGNLGNLQLFDFSNNNVSIIPTEIGRCTKLQNLYLMGNPIVDFPKQIIELLNLKEIRFPEQFITSPVYSALIERVNRVHIITRLDQTPDYRARVLFEYNSGVGPLSPHTNKDPCCIS